MGREKEKKGDFSIFFLSQELDFNLDFQLSEISQISIFLLCEKMITKS